MFLSAFVYGLIATIGFFALIVLISFAWRTSKNNRKSNSRVKFYADEQRKFLLRENEIKEKAKPFKKAKTFDFKKEPIHDLIRNGVFYVGDMFGSSDGTERMVLKYAYFLKPNVDECGCMRAKYEATIEHFNSTETKEFEIIAHKFNVDWFVNQELADERVLELIKQGDCPYLNTDPFQ